MGLTDFAVLAGLLVLETVRRLPSRSVLGKDIAGGQCRLGAPRDQGESAALGFLGEFCKSQSAGGGIALQLQFPESKASFGFKVVVAELLDSSNRRTQLFESYCRDRLAM
jgi:hypothetical protein